MTSTMIAPPLLDFSTIIASGLGDEPVAHLVETAMRRLVEAGVPLHRMHVGFRILHPLFDGMSINWTDEAGVAVEYFENLDVDNSVYRLSPFYHMLSNGLTEFRARLDRDACVADFPLLADLKERGHTDYLALIVAFGGAALHPETHDGLGTSWATRDARGFSDAHVCAMRQVLAPLALALRVVIKDQITRNALNTFHGPLVGGRILSGTIKRGAGERLAAALWYSDLRNSTGLADQMPVEDFLDLRRLGRIDVIPGGEAHLGRFGRQLRGRRVVTFGCATGFGVGSGGLECFDRSPVSGASLVASAASGVSRASPGPSVA